MKLIRDKVPDLASARGEALRTRLVGTEERRRLLKAKLVEEALELQAADDGSEAEVEELADVIEVVRRLCDDLELSDPGRIQATYEQRLDEMGEIGFVVLLDEGEE